MFTLSKDALLHTEDACCTLYTGILKMKSPGNKKRHKKNVRTWKQMFTLSEDALLHTKDACCTLYCEHTVKPLFNGLREVETVDRWV